MIAHEIATHQRPNKLDVSNIDTALRNKKTQYRIVGYKRHEMKKYFYFP